MPKLDLEAIKARAEAATPPPWETDDSMPACTNPQEPGSVIRLTSDTTRIMTYVTSGDEHSQTISCVPANMPVYDILPKTRADQLFIAHAREDVPALVAEIERLQLFNRRLALSVAQLHNMITLGAGDDAALKTALAIARALIKQYNGEIEGQQARSICQSIGCSGQDPKTCPGDPRCEIIRKVSGSS